MGKRVAGLAAAAALLADPAGAVVSSPPVYGGTPAQRALLRHVVTALGGTQVSRIAISRVGRGGVNLVMQPNRLDRSRASQSVRLQWDAQLVAYSFLRLSEHQDLPPVLGFSVAGHSWSFRSARPRPLPAFDRSRILRPVQSAQKRSGGKVLELNLFRPAGPALTVVTATARPAQFIHHRLAPVISALNGVAPRLDGFYVAIVDNRGAAVFAYSKVQERGVSSTALWVRSDLRRCAENLPVENEVAPDGAPRCPS
jgi:hypothetical protein